MVQIDALEAQGITCPHARDLIAMLDHHEIERAVLVGHSMGTQVSLEAYRLAPDNSGAPLAWPFS